MCRNKISAQARKVVSDAITVLLIANADLLMWKPLTVPVRTQIRNQNYAKTKYRLVVYNSIWAWDTNQSKLNSSDDFSIWTKYKIQLKFFIRFRDEHVDRRTGGIFCRTMCGLRGYSIMLKLPVRLLTSLTVCTNCLPALLTEKKKSLVISVINEPHLLMERLLLYVVVRACHCTPEQMQTTTIIRGMFQNYFSTLRKARRAKSLLFESSFQMCSLVFYIRPTLDVHFLHLLRPCFTKLFK